MIAHYLNYTIEEVMDHDLDWIALMGRNVAIDEFEKNMFDLSVHGVDRDRIGKIRREFYQSIGIKTKSETKIYSIEEFRMMGLSVGRPNKTAVKR